MCAQGEEPPEQINRQPGARKSAGRARRDSTGAARLHNEQLLAMLAHELRNPLAPISNAVQILKLEGPNGPNFRWSLEVIENQVAQLKHMVDDLLDAWAITRGLIVLKAERINLLDVVERAIRAARPLLDGRGYRLTVSLPEIPVVIDVDGARLTQALTNLLTNAAKFTNRGGEIALTALAGHAAVEIRVVDSGIGIAPELVPHVFELFTQADQTLSRSRGGLGIGLAVVRSLVELHRGRVYAESDGPDRGSTFVIQLPLAPARQRIENPGVAASGFPAAAFRRRRILVADDNERNANSLAVLLRALGQDVEIACDGQAALAYLSDHAPALALLDLGLPGMDGYEVARRCRLENRLKQVTLVALTGYGCQRDKERSREAGFDAHFVKPVNLDDLKDLLRQSPRMRLKL
jgi:two-component system CheB/CheR fusion protein